MRRAGSFCTAGAEALEGEMRESEARIHATIPRKCFFNQFHFWRNPRAIHVWGLRVYPSLFAHDEDPIDFYSAFSPFFPRCWFISVIFPEPKAFASIFSSSLSARPPFWPPRKKAEWKTETKRCSTRSKSCSDKRRNVLIYPSHFRKLLRRITCGCKASSWTRTPLGGRPPFRMKINTRPSTGLYHVERKGFIITTYFCRKERPESDGNWALPGSHGRFQSKVLMALAILPEWMEKCFNSRRKLPPRTEVFLL